MAVSYLEARLLEALNEQVDGWGEADAVADDLVWDRCADRYVEAALKEADA